MWPVFNCSSVAAFGGPVTSWGGPRVIARHDRCRDRDQQIGDPGPHPGPGRPQASSTRALGHGPAPPRDSQQPAFFIEPAHRGGNLGGGATSGLLRLLDRHGAQARALEQALAMALERGVRSLGAQVPDPGSAGPRRGPGATGGRDRARRLGLYGLLAHWEEVQGQSWLPRLLEIEDARAQSAQTGAQDPHRPGRLLVPRPSPCRSLFQGRNPPVWDPIDRANDKQAVLGAEPDLPQRGVWRDPGGSVGPHRLEIVQIEGDSCRLGSQETRGQETGGRSKKRTRQDGDSRFCSTANTSGLSLRTRMPARRYRGGSAASTPEVALLTVIWRVSLIRATSRIARPRPKTSSPVSLALLSS